VVLNELIFTLWIHSYISSLNRYLGSHSKARSVIMQFDAENVEFGVDKKTISKLTTLGADSAQAEKILMAFDVHGYGIINILDFLCGKCVIVNAVSLLFINSFFSSNMNSEASIQFLSL
jgi:hypothetical protein